MTSILSGHTAEDTDDYVDPFRTVGFSYQATEFPRCEAGVRAIAAWNNVPVDKLPAALRFYPNASTKAAWERVITAVCAPSSVGSERPASNREAAGSSPAERATSTGHTAGRLVALAAVSLILAGCNNDIDPEVRAAAFKECLASVPAGPQQTHYNDWAEVVSACEGYAVRHALSRSGGEPSSKATGEAQ